MKVSKKVRYGALTAGMWISWIVAGVVVGMLIISELPPELRLALIGIAASLVSTGFSQLGILSQMKGD